VQQQDRDERALLCRPEGQRSDVPVHLKRPEDAEIHLFFGQRRYITALRLSGA
jgi:hypothetical protein